MKFIPAKTIITKTNNIDWFGTEYNMNIYKGCCHGCIYCDSRSECYQIKDFDTVRAKQDAIEIINRELKSKRKKGIVATGSMSDPYNPFEAEYEFTRKALKLINKYNFGIAIATKSDLVTRDIDILQDIKKYSPVIVKITITTGDDSLCKKLEPNVAVASKRFDAIKRLSASGIFTGILLMPVLSFIEDSDENILNIIRLAKESGAKFIYPAFGVTLRQNQRNYFFKKLDEQFYGTTQRYIKEYGFSYECRSKRATALWKLFKEECDKANILYKMQDIITAYKKDYEKKQLSLF
ncbi:SPL family radical SAM protein [Clostridium ganghwense]|uniref:Radical SAM protein n=1 Tax=Clostridium ganghwense TaxID=312089 RepID=A0ABT4CTI5_9CLOT|nr:radical SAM protein [Clostridium ganghwense]MCY6371743.1 radical SAM protein [Clostridium ganghwense]